MTHETGVDVDWSHLRLVASEGILVDAAKPGPPLQTAGGGGTFDDMEARVARLESDVGHIKDDMREVKELLRGAGTNISALQVSVATLTERSLHAPTKGFIVAAVTASLILLGLLVTFQQSVQHFLGQSAPPTTVAPTRSR